MTKQVKTNSQAIHKPEMFPVPGFIYDKIRASSCVYSSLEHVGNFLLICTIAKNIGVQVNVYVLAVVQQR